MKTRYPWADTLRGLLMLLIVMGHVAPEGVLKHYAYAFHVPGFFLVSGYLFRFDEGAGSFLRRKARTLLLPYLAFSLISIGAYMLLGGVAAQGLAVETAPRSLTGHLADMLYGSGARGGMKWNLPLWFLPCLFATQTVTWLILRLARRTSLSPAAICAALLALSLGAGAVNHHLLRITGLPLQLETALYMLPFFLGGMLLRMAGDRALDALRSAPGQLAGVACVLLGGWLALRWNPRVDYVASVYNHYWVFLCAAALSVAGCAALAQCLRCRVLDAVSRGSMAVLLMHKFPVVLLQLLLSKPLSAGGWLSVVLTLAITAVSTALCLLCGAVLERLLPCLLGRQRG